MTKNTETTRRALYECLDRIRRAGKHRKLTLEFEGLLEEHLEAITPKLMMMFADELLEERNGLQARLHAIDTAYVKSQEALSVAGEALRENKAELEKWQKEVERLDARKDRAEEEMLRWKKLSSDQGIIMENQRKEYVESQEALDETCELIRELEPKVAGYHSDAITLRLERDRLIQENKDLDAVVRNQRQAYAELFMVKNETSDRCHILDMSKAKLLLAKAALLEHKLLELKK